MRIEDLRFAIDGIDYLVTNYFFCFPLRALRLCGGDLLSLSS